MELYRATTETETGIPLMSCWTDKVECAEAYTEDGVGHGGDHIREIETDGEILDVSCRSGVDFRALAEALGYTEDDADDWRTSGYRYPWEEVEGVKQALIDSEYDWLVYEDDYPDDCTTYVRITH